MGGALLALGGWRLIFLVNLPAGAAGLALGWFLLPRSRSRRAAGRPDRAGAGLLALAVGGPLVYLSLGSRMGYADPALLIALVAGLGSAIQFVRLERRIEDPLIDLSILREPPLRRGLGTGLVSYMVLFGTLFVVPYYLSAEHVRPALVGLELALLPIGIGVAATVAGRLLNRVGERPLTTGGLILTGCGLLEPVLWRSTPGLLAGLALAGIGLGAFTPANNATIMAASSPGYTGLLGGALNMTRGMGTALGVVFAGVLYTAASGVSGMNIADADRAAAARGLVVTLLVLALAALASGVATSFGKRRRGSARKGQA